MEKMAEKLAKLLLRENVISNSMLEIYQYGFLRMLEIGSAVLTSFAICLIMGMLKEGIIFFAFLSRYVLIWVDFIWENIGSVISCLA